MAKLTRRRIAGIALFAGGLVALGILLAMNPFPAPYGPWLAGEEGSVLLISFGPAVATRYDPGTDTTIAVLDCWYATCPVAAQIAGNVSDELRTPNILLFSPDGAPERGEVDLSEPIRVPSPPEAPEFVTAMTAQRFEVGNAYAPLLMYQLAFTATVVGLLLALGAADTVTIAGSLGGAMGVVAGTLLAAANGFGEMPLGWVLMTLAVAAGIVSFVLARRQRRSAALPAALLAFAAALLFSQQVATRYFLHGPAV